MTDAVFQLKLREGVYGFIDELLLIETIPCVGQRFRKRSDRVSAEELICERKSCFRFDCRWPELSWLM